MPIKIRKDTLQAESKLITFKCVLPDPLPDPPISYPDFTRSVLVPERVSLYQKFWDESWNGTRKTWKNCENYKISSSKKFAELQQNVFVENANSSPYYSTAPCDSGYARYRIYSYAGSWIDPFGAPGQPHSGLPAFDQPNAIDGTFVPPPANLENLNSIALKTMLPRIKADLSLVNSIIELKDFKNLPGLIRKFHEVVPFIRNSLKKGNPLKVFRDFLRLPAETYLTYQFAIAPLINDIRGIYASLTKYQAQISDLINREGKTQTRHFSYKWLEYPAHLFETGTSIGLDQPGYILFDPAYTWTQTREVFCDASEFHAEIQYNYNYTQFQRQHADVLGLLDRLGVNFNAQIIWNALPWSFVLDWVLDVNRFLGQYANTTNMEPVINIQQYLWSIKRRRRIQVNVVCNTRHPAVSEPYQKGSQISMPLVTETAYRRQIGIPGYSSLTSSGLSLKELSLGAALVSTRGRYHGPRSIPAPKTR
jgi:hypothetical protein